MAVCVESEKQDEISGKTPLPCLGGATWDNDLKRGRIIKEEQAIAGGIGNGGDKTAAKLPLLDFKTP